MEMNLHFPNPARTTGAEIFAMEHEHRLTEDLQAQRMTMVDFLDYINYENGDPQGEPFLARQTMAWHALALPSMAYIDPHKTREALYYIGSVARNLTNPHMQFKLHPYNSENLIAVQQGVAAGLYRMVSGRAECDDFLYDRAAWIARTATHNSFLQHVTGIDNQQGRFDVVTNVLALMALFLCDRGLGTDYSFLKDGFLDLVFNKLRNDGTGLFYESYQTGSLHVPYQYVNPANAWHPTALTARTNGLALALAHWLDPDATEKGWDAFKARFLDQILGLDTETLADDVGMSYLTQLGPSSETLLGALLAAREMDDVEAFDKLQRRFFEIGDPNLWEGHFVLNALGSHEGFIGHFAFLARIHVGWAKLFAHDWENHYDDDYVEVR